MSLVLFNSYSVSYDKVDTFPGLSLKTWFLRDVSEATDTKVATNVIRVHVQSHEKL